MPETRDGVCRVLAGGNGRPRGTSPGRGALASGADGDKPGTLYINWLFEPATTDELVEDIYMHTLPLGIREAPGRKVLVVGNHDFNRRTGLLDAAGQGVATGILAIDSDPPMVLTHLPMRTLPLGWVKLYGHVHNNEPLLDTPHINVCVEHTDYRPLPLESLLTLGKRLLAGRVPEGATTADRISKAVGSELSSGA